MNDGNCVEFLQWALPHLKMRWPGFRKVRRQVCRRVLRRIEQLDLEGVAGYREYLQQHQDEWAKLDEFCRISISRFYRDRGVFGLLRTEVLPMLAAKTIDRGRSCVRIWSAGCASGEEPYTLRIIWTLDIEPRFPDIRLRIVATDADRHLLDRATRAYYPSSSLKDLPDEWIRLAFEPTDDLFRLRDEFRKDIQFQPQDVRGEPPAGPFDMILCRHLAFTYFDEQTQRATLGSLVDQLESGGILVTGKQETLPVDVGGLEECFDRSGIYQLVDP